MEPEEMFGSLDLNKSNMNQEQYWMWERQRLLDQQKAGTINPEYVDEEGKIVTGSDSFNQFLRDAEEREKNSPTVVEAEQQKLAAKPFYETGKQHKFIHNNPEGKLLKSHIPYEVGENNPSHPNYEAIYGDTANWSWAQAATNVTGLIGGLGHLGDFGVADDKAELHRNRKHLFTSGSGEADLETNMVELRNTVQGAAYQLVNGVLSLPETSGRILSGQNPFSEKFQLSWDPLASIGLEEPWTGTKFGDAGKVIGSFAVGGAGSASLLTKLSKVKKLGALAGWIGGLNNTQKVMLGEALYMQASPYRLDPGMANLIKESTFFGDTPVFKEALSMIAVGENDHPAVKQLKNTLEAAGMVGVFGKLFAIFGDTAKFGAGALDPRQGKQLKALKELDLNNLPNTELGRMVNNIASQHDELGRAQLALEAAEFKTPNVPKATRFRAAKNHPVAGVGQGNLLSTNSSSRVYRQLNQLDDIGYGSVDPIITGRESELAAQSAEFTPQFLKSKAKEMLGDPYIQGLIKDAERQGKTFEQVFEPAFRRFKDTIGGDIDKLSTEEFWSQIKRGLDASNDDLMEYVVATDLVNQSLFKEIRDLSNVGRELHKITDIFDTDGITKPIAEKLVMGLSNVKRARYLISSEYRNLGKAARKAALAERTALLHDETVDGVRLMMQFLRGSNSDELAQGILEVFSMSNKIKNFKDFDAWMRQKLRGGEFGGKNTKGILTKELGAVMINSILSSPKTPLRAIMGTTANAYLNEVATLFGATIRRPFTGDVAAMRAAAASSNAMLQLIPDAMKVFKHSLDANFAGDLATIKTRYSRYTPGDANFELLGRWAEKHGTNGDKAAFYIANAARQANSNKLYTWSSRVLGSTDDTFRWLLSKSRARKKAIEKVMGELGDDIEINPEMLSKIEDIEFKRLHNEDGVLDITKDAFLEKNFKEVTLTTELQGFTKGLDELMNRYPLTKPFFLFARTGINGLRMSVKNLPIVGAMVDESRAILGATPAMAKEGHLLKYGIETAADLASAKSLVIGRQAIGTMVVYGIAQKYMAGEITGNGPASASMKKMWTDFGWQPRSIKIGNVWVGYDSFEPFNLVMANIADIGDNLELMGPTFAEERLQLVVAALGKSVTSKTYLQGINQLFDVLGGEGGGYKLSKISANLINNQLPLAGMRNDIGKLLNPAMRELGSNFWDHVANRNPGLKATLPIKYDMLNGKPINPWGFMERLLKSGPITLSMDKGPGRSLLFKSGYDLRIFAYTAPDGTSLRKHPKIRSKFQNAIGKYNLEKELDKLAGRLDIQTSMLKMQMDRAKGNYNLDPMKAYRHNKIIARLFKRIAKRAWADLRNDPMVKELMDEKRDLNRANNRSLRDTQTLLRQPK
tara:strand:+ start:8408 stop:12529 length:4122 start_codon:yes stop_codon:yes gene_type:complete